MKAAATPQKQKIRKCQLCDSRRAMAADCVNCYQCCRADPEDLCGVATHAYDPNQQILPKELEDDLASDSLLDGIENAESKSPADLTGTSLAATPKSTPRSVPCSPIPSAEARTLQMLEKLALQVAALQANAEEAKERQLAEQESALRTSRTREKAGEVEDLISSLDLRAHAAMDGGSREAMLQARSVQGRGQGSRVPPLRGPRVGLAGLPRQAGPARTAGRDAYDFPRQAGPASTAGRDAYDWSAAEDEKEEDRWMGRGFDYVPVAGSQVGMDHPRLPQYIFDQMRPNAHAYAKRNNYSKYRQKEMSMLGLAVHRFDQEGCKPTAGSGMAVLLRRMAALDALEQGHSGDLADAIEEPGAMMLLYPQLAMTQATIFASKQRKLRAKSDKLKPDAAKPRRDS
jgi:hypothetical protein